MRQACTAMAAFEAADALWSSCAPSATPAFRTAGAGGEAASYSTETPPAVPAHALATALERSFPEVGRADRVVRFVIQAARPVGQEHAMVSREEVSAVAPSRRASSNRPLDRHPGQQQC